MSVDLDIINKALFTIGADSIASFNDNTREAKIAKLEYETTVVSALSTGNYRFSMKQALLVKNATVPILFFKYKHDLPTDFLKLVNTHPFGIDYEVLENKFIHSDYLKLSINYCYRIPNESFPALFQEYLRLIFVSKFAESLEGDTRLSISSLQQAQLIQKQLEELKLSNSRKKYYVDNSLSNAWLNY